MLCKLWKVFDPNNIEDLKDDCNYLVCYRNYEGKYSLPHKAYWIADEKKFFSLENNNSHPIHVDVYIEMPSLNLR